MEKADKPVQRTQAHTKTITDTYKARFSEYKSLLSDGAFKTAIKERRREDALKVLNLYRIHVDSAVQMEEDLFNQAKKRHTETMNKLEAFCLPAFIYLFIALLVPGIQLALQGRSAVISVIGSIFLILLPLIILRLAHPPERYDTTVLKELREIKSIVHRNYEALEELDKLREVMMVGAMKRMGMTGTREPEPEETSIR
jgi:hypothetical protein